MDLKKKVIFANSKSETWTDFHLQITCIFYRYFIRTKLRTFDLGSFENINNITGVM